MASGLLKPMGPDSLLRRPAPQAAASGEKAPLALRAEPEAEPLLQPAAFAQPGEEPDLLAGFVIEEDPDEPDDTPDLVDSSLMPDPACVPLYDLDVSKPRRAWWLMALLLGAAALAAFFILK